MSHLYAKTVWYRATVTADPKLIVKPHPQKSPTGAYRTVRLFVQDEPEVEIAIDGDLAIDARDSYWPNPPTNKVICLNILPGQTVSARSKGDLHELSVCIEHWAPG